MKAVLNVETYLHCSQDLRGTQHGLWPGLSPNLHLSDYGRVARSVVAAETFECAAFRAVGDKIVVLTMIHPELLSRLCRARDLLRDWEDAPISITAIARASGL